MTKEKQDVLIVTAPIKIEDGKHDGIITDVIRNLPNEADGRQYDYIDLVIKVTDTTKEPEIKVGYPTNISELSALGRLLKKAGMDFSEGDEITIKNIKETLIDRVVTFLSKNKVTENGEFANILRDTVDFK